MGSIERLIWNGTEWLGRHPLGPVTTDRDALVYGTYDPTPELVGPLPTVTSFTELNPDSGRTYTTLSGGNIDLNGYEIWGEIRNRSADTVIRNSLIHGPDPTNLTGLTGAVKAYDQHQRIKFVDCKFDPSPWVTERGAPGLSPNSTAMHGANYTLERCELVNWQDGVNLVATTAEADSQYTEILGSILHKGYFQNAWTTSGAPSDRRTHGDSVQFNYIKHMLINGCILGGSRNPAGYLIWPGGYNAGDDFWNTAIMLKQEGTWGVNPTITDVTIKNSILGGGTSTVNVSYQASKPNNFSTVRLENLRFMERKTDWGRSANLAGGFDSLNGGLGRYFLKSTSAAPVMSNLTILETGAAVPITGQADGS